MASKAYDHRGLINDTTSYSGELNMTFISRTIFIQVLMQIIGHQCRLPEPSTRGKAFGSLAPPGPKILHTNFVLEIEYKGHEG